MNRVKYILVVHHDADLYGSDKSLLRTLRALKASALTPIVALPHEGPLVPLLRAESIEVHIGPVGKLTRQLLKPQALPAVAVDMFRAVRFISRIVAGRNVVLAYSNSVAVLGGALWSLLHGVPRLWHVREIVIAPKIAAWGFPLMLRVLGGWCVCNSNATRSWIIGERPSLASRSSVIWNGLEEMQLPEPVAAEAFRASHGLAADDVVVTLVGRINRWKGQDVLIRAAGLLKSRGVENVRYLVVGDVADGQVHFRERMLAQIRDAGLEGVVQWLPFTAEVDVVWAASDIGVVPSTEPEPFGRVAIEAMAHELPVVASAHGGLAEIVENGATGYLVPPGDVEMLANVIAQLVVDPTLRRTLGAAGRVRQRLLFSQEKHDEELLKLMSSLAVATSREVTP